MALKRRALPGRATIVRRPPSRRRTYAIAALAGASTIAVAIAELGRVWRRGPAPLPTETDDVLGAGAEAALDTVEIAVEGYRASPARENAQLNLLLSFLAGFAAVRGSTYTIRRRGTFGPFRNLKVGERHIHHFVPGIGLAFVSGGTAIVTRNEDVERWLAIPFGLGLALTLDESALLLQLEDVYWTEEGVLSVQIALAVVALLASLTLARRLLRRGEARVMPEAFDDDPIIW